jgi:hypothetical protein
MALTKYQRILGSFIVIAAFLALLFAAIVFKGDGREERIEGWETAYSGGIEFQYPKDFAADYIHPQDWPPEARVLPDAFACIEAGDEAMQGGRTSMRRINGREYCVTEVVQGAAGSVYTQYAYVFPYESGSGVMTFTIRAPQCANYPEIEMAECQAERDVFSMDAVMDRVIGTVH